MSRYSKKHYEDIAEIIRLTRDDGSRSGYYMDNMVERLTIMFSADNPNFDRERFLEATR